MITYTYTYTHTHTHTHTHIYIYKTYNVSYSWHELACVSSAAIGFTELFFNSSIRNLFSDLYFTENRKNDIFWST